MPAWTLSTLAFSWLLFPLLQSWLRAASGATRLGWLPPLLLCLLLVLAPVPLRLLLHGGMGWATYGCAYHWPPFRVPDFAFGMCVAEALVRTRWGEALGRRAPRLFGRLADAIVPLFILLVGVAHWPGEDGAAALDAASLPLSRGRRGLSPPTSMRCVTLTDGLPCRVLRPQARGQTARGAVSTSSRSG